METLDQNLFTTEQTTRGQSDWPEWKHQMAAAMPYWTCVLLACAMLGTGCSVDLQDVKNSLKKPVFMVIGAVFRFILLPLFSLGLSYVLGLSEPEALGFIIAACSPGGLSSNIFTACMDGDVSLSKGVVVTDKVLALGLVPLNLYIYSLVWTRQSVQVPYITLVVILACIMACVILGLLIEWKLERLARVITKIGAFLGLFLMILFIICQALLYPDIFITHWQVWLAAVLFPLVGLLFRFLLALICCCTAKHCQAIAIETGTENLCITFTLITMSYSGLFAAEACVIPILTGLTVTIAAGCILMSYKLHVARKKTHKEKRSKSKSRTTEDKDMALQEI